MKAPRARAPRAKASTRQLKAKAMAGSVRALGSLRARARQIGTALGASSKNVSPEQKAIFHCVSGAGRSRVIRDFFNLSPLDVEQARGTLDAIVAKRLST